MVNSTDDKILEAEKEAKRFIEKVSILKESEEFQKYRSSKKRAAVKRASMDLSRSLSDLRRGNEY